MSLNGPSLTGLRRVLAEDRNYARVRAEAARGFAARSEDYQISAPAGLRSALLAEMADGLAALADNTAKHGGQPAAGPPAPVVLAVTATGREAEDLTEALRAFLPADAVAEFPSWETLPHERLSPRSDTVGRRLSVLRRLAHPETSAGGALRVVVAPVRAVVQPIVAGLGELVPVTLKVGQEAPFSDVVQSLADAAYARVDMVTRRGEFAVRGGMLDVFPPTEDHPIRVEFFGDEVDQMRWFAVADQRSLTAPGVHHPTELHAPPCREILITPSVMSRAATLKSQLPAAADMLEKIAGGIAVEGMESLAPVLVDAMVPFLDQLPAGSIAVVIEPEKVRTRAHDLAATNEEFLEAAWSTASDGGTAPLDLSSAASRGPAFGQLPLARPRPAPQPSSTSVSWWSITSLATDEELLPDVDVLNLHAREPRGYQGDVAEMMDFIGSHVRDQWRIVVVTEGPGPAQRLAELFHDNDIPCARVDTLDDEPAGRADRGDHGRRRTRFCPGAAQAGAADRGRPAGPDLRRFHQGHAPDAVQAAERRGPAAARGRGLRGARTARHRPVRGADPAQGGRRRATGVREYLVLEYAPSKRGAPGDRLFVPTDQLDQVTRYVGGDTPALSKMGGADWASTKSKARKAVKEIAGELIRLYSARMASRGLRLRPGHPVAARARGGLPLRGDPGPADHHQRGQGGHGARDPDGPADLRRRRLRQDRDRGPRRVQGRPGRQAGGRAGAHHAAGPAALRDLHRAVLRLPAAGQAAVPLPERQGGQGDGRGRQERLRGRGDRHAPAAVQGLRLQGPRPGDRGRGAALRRRAQGGAQEDAHQRGRPGHERHPDSRGPWRCR